VAGNQQNASVYTEKAHECCEKHRCLPRFRGGPETGNVTKESDVTLVCDGVWAARELPEKIALIHNEKNLTHSSPLFIKEIAMILVRDIFQLKFGKAKDAKALAKEGESILNKYGGGSTVRYLTDLTGPFYIFVMESTYENLAAFEKAMSETMGKKELGEWYQKFVPLIDSGRREIFTIVS
jgi:hypothetical protein